MPSHQNKPIAQWEGTLLLSRSRVFFICSQSTLQSAVLTLPSRLTAAESVSTEKLEKPSGHSEAEPVVAEGCA